MRLYMLTLASLALPSASLAQTCGNYVGQTAQLQTFDTVAKILKAIPSKKGEYETTEQFETRVETAKKTLPGTVIIPGVFSPEHVEYDADAGALRVKSYALRNLNTSYGEAFLATAHPMMAK